jgi:hypothetical protein
MGLQSGNEKKHYRKSEYKTNVCRVLPNGESLWLRIFPKDEDSKDEYIFSMLKREIGGKEEVVGWLAVERNEKGRYFTFPSDTFEALPKEFVDRVLLTKEKQGFFERLKEEGRKMRELQRHSS